VNTAGIGFVVDAQMFRIVTAVANLSAVSAEDTGIPVTFVDGVCALLATVALLSVVAATAAWNISASHAEQLRSAVDA
jgi:hypothetical protein